jgi:hypothetical protein
MNERWRCAPGENVWHSTSRCSQWPLLDYWSHSRKPLTGERCAECAALDDSSTTAVPMSSRA